MSIFVYRISKVDTLVIVNFWCLFRLVFYLETIGTQYDEADLNKTSCSGLKTATASIRIQKRLEKT